MVLGKARNGLYQVQHADLSLDRTAEGLQRMENDYQASKHSNLSRHSNLCSSGADQWHYRLGHLSFDKLKQLGLPYNNRKSETTSTICPKARLHRQPFPLSTTRASRIFELIHVDIWGAYKCVTHDGYKYFLTIVDDLLGFI